MTSWNLISHMCETRKFVMAMLQWTQGLLCDKNFLKFCCPIKELIRVITKGDEYTPKSPREEIPP